MLVYKCTNKISGKCYIGQTARKFEVRKRQHLSDAKRGMKSHFYNSIRKHGEESFIWEILETHVSHINKLNSMEIFYISWYDTFKGVGYNMTSGGENNGLYSDESRLKISLAGKKRLPHSEETRRKIGAFHKGREKSEETKRRMSKAQNGRIFTKKNHCENISIGAQNMSDETKHQMKYNMSKNHANFKGKNNPMARAIIINNTYYDTITAAAKKLIKY